MKRLILAVMAITLMAAPMANAQKVNKAAIVAKLDKVDADSKDAKKSGKAATWLTRGNAYFEAVSAPVSALFVGMEEAMLALTIGKPEAQNANVELNGKVCTEHVYPWVKIYTADGKVATWIVTQTVKEGDLAGEAVASFKKAYELDAKLASKVADGLSKVENYYSTMGNVCLDAGLAAQAAQYYMAAYTTQNTPGYGGQVKNDYLYYAGYLYVVDGATNPDSYAKGAEVLNKALEAGYADADGFIYYYLFHAYYGQKDSSVRVANLQRAKTILMEGLAKFPANTLIVEGLIGLYTDRENPVGDPQELVSMVDGALERDPQNVQATYNLALSYIFQGDAMNDEMNSRDYKSNADFQADQKKVIEAYKPAVPVLEAAHKLDPKHLGVLETLKSLTFRLRDEEGMMAKYEQYNKALNELKAQ